MELNDVKDVAAILVGLTLAEAQVIAAERRLLLRVVMQDGFQFYVSSEINRQRINLVLIDGRVIEVSVG